MYNILCRALHFRNYKGLSLRKQVDGFEGLYIIPRVYTTHSHHRRTFKRSHGPKHKRTYLAIRRRSSGPMQPRPDRRQAGMLGNKPQRLSVTLQSEEISILPIIFRDVRNPLSASHYSSSLRKLKFYESLIFDVEEDSVLPVTIRGAL